jgi:hypothetical protein
MHIQATTPRTAGRVAARRGAMLAAAALTGAALLSACGSSGSSGTTSGGNLDTARVALSIEQSILSERHIKAKGGALPTLLSTPRATSRRKSPVR